jgi:O-antigen/teichoic acid export membrane protein
MAAAESPGTSSGVMRRTAHKLTLNFVVLASAELLVKLLTFAAFAWLARTLGPERYGDVEFVVAMMAIFTLASELGLSDYGAREAARAGEDGGRLVRELVALRMALAVCSLLAVLGVKAMAGKPPGVSALLALYGASLLAHPLLIQWFFQGKDRMDLAAGTFLIRQAVFAGLVLLLLRAGSPLALVGLLECAAVGAAGLWCVIVIRMRFGFTPVSLRVRPKALAEHLRQALPIGLSSVSWAFLWYFATVLLGMFLTGRTLGWYGASHRAALAAHTFVWLYFFNLLPSISRIKGRPFSDLVRLLSGSIRMSAWSGIFAAFVVTALSKELLTLAYGPGFSGGAGLFAMLIWMVPVALLSGHYRYTLIGFNLQKWLCYCAVGSAGISIGLSFFLVRWFGAPGAAATLLIANVADFGFAYLCVRRFIGRVRFLPHTAGPLSALAAAWGSFLAAHSAGAWLAAACGAAAYLAVLAVWEWRRWPEVWAFLRNGGAEPA